MLPHTIAYSYRCFKLPFLPFTACSSLPYYRYFQNPVGSGYRFLYASWSKLPLLAFTIVPNYSGPLKTRLPFTICFHLPFVHKYLWPKSLLSFPSVTVLSLHVATIFHCYQLPFYHLTLVSIPVATSYRCDQLQFYHLTLLSVTVSTRRNPYELQLCHLTLLSIIVATSYLSSQLPLYHLAFLILVITVATS